MTEKSNSVNVRFSETAHNRLVDFCEFTGLKMSEVVRCAVTSYVAQCGQNVGFTRDASRTPVLLNNINKYNNTYDCVDVEKPKSDEVQIFFRAFWVKVKNRFFPERVVSVMKKHWSALHEWGGGPSELARLYNEYCAAEKHKGREFSHPNSWLAGHGWLNDSSTANRIGYGEDVDVDMTQPQTKEES